MQANIGRIKIDYDSFRNGFVIYHAGTKLPVDTGTDLNGVVRDMLDPEKPYNYIEVTPRAACGLHPFTLAGLRGSIEVHNKKISGSRYF